jgi:molybdopterin-guanine dinucleotide biosynthesis protein A
MTPGTFFTAAILAGWQARRLGAVDKRALSVGTQSILGPQLALLRGLTPHILVVANDAAPFRKTGVPL